MKIEELIAKAKREPEMEELNLTVWNDDFEDGTYNRDMFIGMLKTETIEVIDRFKTGCRIKLCRYQYNKLLGNAN